MKDPSFDPREAERTRGVSGKNNPKGGKKLKDLLKKESVESDFESEKKRRKARFKGEGGEGQENPLRSAQVRGHDQEPTAANLAAEKRRRELKKHPGINPVKGDKVDEEVGISSAAAMEKARKEAKLKAKEEAAVKKAQKIKEEKKALPKLKMYRKAGNLARAGDEKSMKRQTKMVSVLNKETEKGYKKAALDKLRDGGSPKHQVSEDRAFDNVVAALRAKHGKDAVLTKDSPKPKAQIKPKAKPQKPLTDAEKNQREVDARYGRTPWNPKGSLGT